jgi:GTP-binding protein YchF
MQVGIAGYRGAGKTTVFNCLTGAQATTGYGGAKEANRGVIKVPDERIDKLAAIFQPKKTTYADIAFVDVPPPPEGVDDSGIDKQSAAELRKMDALVNVVRAFGAEQGVPPRQGSVDLARDLVDYDSELTLLDVVVLETRIERLKKERKQGLELEQLEKLHAHFGDGEKPARVVDIDDATRAAITGFQFLSLKPQLSLLNFGDGATAAEIAAAEDSLRKIAGPRGIEVMSMRGTIEAEIAGLAPEDQHSFLADLGLTETARARFIRSCYAMLDLIAFFTVGEDEVRAWTIKKGTPAVRAAGKIHSDLERGFIRAEVVSYEEFMKVGKLSKAREAGKLRLEGKEYVVQDGDIINVRFAV